MRVVAYMLGLRHVLYVVDDVPQGFKRLAKGVPPIVRDRPGQSRKQVVAGISERKLLAVRRSRETLTIL